ncbi:MAG TPA: hypothetical protein VHU19_17420 [Pyrinomonadaceae bacterium]|jgi:hypothetical protein|nr:hypothetical protein [Pyrinomonadaceae bacterium]
MADCKTYREEIEELAGVGRLSLGARAHVNACEGCRGLERERASLRHLVRGLERVEAPSDFEFRLRARMNASRASERRNPLRPVYGFAALAAAACFLLVSASFYIRQVQERKPDAARQQTAIKENAGGAANSAQKVEVAQVPDVNTASTIDSGALGVQGKRVKLKTRATPPQRAREVALRESPGVATQKNFLTAGFGSAQVIEPSPTMRIALGANAEPLRVVLRDERGATRVVPMCAVSFGSQELIAREGASRRAPVSDREGVW